jgi:hypothetical protein
MLSESTRYYLYSQDSTNLSEEKVRPPLMKDSKAEATHTANKDVSVALVGGECTGVE